NVATVPFKPVAQTYGDTEKDHPLSDESSVLLAHAAGILSVAIQSIANTLVTRYFMIILFLFTVILLTGFM
ncbi:MAG: hypothetical protein OEY60_15280, partial [Nitrospira sp.]|nr:hypothetical protein [Nitrospira sp.]